MRHTLLLFGRGAPLWMMAMSLGCGGADMSVSTHGLTLEAPTPEERVLLVSTGDVYVPLACWSLAGRIRQGDECLELVSTHVQLEGGARAQVLEEVPVYACDSTPEDRPQQRGLRLEATSQQNGRDVAAWPSLSALRFRSLSPTPIDELTKAEEAVHRLAPGLPRGDLRQETWNIDIDGDGEGETFYSLVVPGTDTTDPRLGFSALFIDEGDELRLLRRSDYEVLTLRAVLDIDGDGSQELLLEASYYEGHSLRLVRDGTLEALGAWSCGA